jgi:hypothetical protein
MSPGTLAFWRHFVALSGTIIMRAITLGVAFTVSNLLSASDHEQIQKENPSIAAGGPSTVKSSSVSGKTEIPARPKDCSIQPFVAHTKHGDVQFPASGQFVLESHLATTSDVFPQGRLFPRTTKEGIEAHITHSCSELQAISPNVSCDAVYRTRYHKEWTPPEGGKAGQGSVGNLRPPFLEEMFSGNMMWKSDGKPAPGTRFLASFNGKHVVIVLGYETGPNDPKWLGGFQGEVFHYLGADDSKKITIAKLKDQNLRPGPVQCF